MAAFSVPATEHSVTTSWGKENEEASIEAIMNNMMPENGILSMVGDTWNIYEFVRKVAEFQDIIENKNATLVIRPDSGEMRDVLPQVMRLVRDNFWSKTNNKGYSDFDSIKILQGDGIDEDSVTEPFAIAKGLGISADSIMTGSGGGLMQANIDRDTLKFAFKASNVMRAGVDYPIAKNPITDPGKMSKKGRLALVKGDKEFYTQVVDTFDTPWDQLRLVYENGQTYNMETLSTIRERLAV